MDITLHIADDTNSPLFNRETILNVLKDHIIGEIFLQRKSDYDNQFNDGLISAAEYARFLALAADEAHEIVAKLDLS